MKISIENIKQKKGKEKITCLTAYTHPVAKILDNLVDIILVGDSLMMAIYGELDTTSANLQMMINHGRAVAKTCKKALVVVDMPINSYEFSKEIALANAKKIINETNCDAVKIEITEDLIETTKYLVDNKIAVMGHIGLLPQHVKEIGGYKYQGKDQESAQKIYEIAKKLEKTGIFSLVIEAVPAKLASKISQNIDIPTIGIGASLDCDGQVLVIDDLLGLNTDFKPRFVENYENLSQKIAIAVENFCKDVKEKKFPTEKNIL